MNSIFDIKRIVNAFKYSRDGILEAYKTEPAFRQELLLATILIPLSFYVSEEAIERVLLISSIILILIIELINTAIEKVVDRISEEKHPLSKAAKDIGSAIVLLAFVNAITVWGVILSP